MPNQDLLNKENLKESQLAPRNTVTVTNYDSHYSNLNTQKPSVIDAEVINWSSSLQNLLDQPPAMLPKQMILGGMAFFLAFAVWAWFGEIEEVGKAQGKLVTK